jgi:hypothetical protein
VTDGTEYLAGDAVRNRYKGSACCQESRQKDSWRKPPKAGRSRNEAGPSFSVYCITERGKRGMSIRRTWCASPNTNELALCRLDVRI